MPFLDEPEWEADLDELQKAYDKQSALCNKRFTPSIVTGILLRLLQAHFQNPDNIRDEKLKQLVWHDDGPGGAAIQSSILISPLYKYDKRQMQQRPALLVFREEAQANKFPLDSKTLTSLEENGNFQGDKYVVPIKCMHVVRCCAKTSFAADRLGEEVFYRLLEYFPAMRDDFPFSSVDITNLTAPLKVGEGDNENFIVDVVMRWVHLHGWTLTPIAPILKKVRFEDRAV